MIQWQEGAIFDKVPFEGILGLAFPKMSDTGVTPFFDQIVRQKALAKNEFAFYFSLNNSAANAIFWGGVDSRFHNGPIEYYKVTDPTYWSVDLHAFRVGDEDLLTDSQSLASTLAGGSFLMRGSPKAIVDTGTTFFTAEGPLYQEIMTRLPPAPCSEVTQESHPPMVFSLRNMAGEVREFQFTNSQYMAGDGHRCVPAMMRIDLPWKHGPAMILGEVFLRHYYSVFDRGSGADEDARIGLAPAAHSQEVHERLKSLTQGQPAFGDSHAGGSF